MALEQLCRTITRSALATERVRCNSAGQVVLKLQALRDALAWAAHLLILAKERADLFTRGFQSLTIDDDQVILALQALADAESTQTCH